MIDILLVLTLVAAFSITFFLLSRWIKDAKRTELMWEDMNKFKKPKIAGAGGITVIIGFVFSLFLYVGIKTFIFNTTENLVEILAVICTFLLIGLIGFKDDILGWEVGARQYWKVLLTIPVAIPLAVINVSNSVISIPFFGIVDFGILYPLFFVPIAIIGASNGFNMLAGMNGLEAGLGVIILGFMGFVAWQNDLGWVAVIAVVMVASLLAFLIYNWIPAKVFPGDTLTYSIGALIGIVAVLGSMEKIGFILFLPFFVELLLKARYRFQKECFGIPRENGKLELPRGEIHSVTHIALKILKKIDRNTEINTVLLILFVEFVLCGFCWIFLV